MTGAQKDEPRLTISTPSLHDHTFQKIVIISIVLAALYLGQTIFIPLALAVLLTFILTPFVTKLRQFGLPKTFAVTLVTIAAFTLLLTLAFAIGRQVTTFAEELPRYKTTLVEKIQTLKALTSSGPAMERATETLRSLKKELDNTPPGAAAQSINQQAPAPPVRIAVDQPSTPLEQLRQTVDVLGPPLILIGVVIIFVVILLLYREDVRDRAIRLLGIQDLARTTRALDDAGQRLNRYFIAITLINTIFGVVIGLGLWLIGIPNPLLWALFAAMLRFVPFIGVPIAALLPLLLAIVADPGWTMLAYTAALFVVSEILVSQVVETYVHGEATGLSPLAIIIATTFWTLLWGPVGLVLAVPLTVMLFVLGNHSDQFAVFDILLGAAPALTPSDRFYQRILAGDPEEAADQAEEQLKKLSLLNYYDTVVMDGLKKAASDIENGKLDPNRVVRFKGSLDTFIETALELDEENRETVTPTLSNKDASIICIGARSKLDDVAATMLAQVLVKREATAAFATVAELFDDAHTVIAKTAPIIICLSAFDVGMRGAYTKFLIKRLHRRFPHARFVGCFWRLDLDGNVGETQLASLNANDVVTSLAAAVDHCLIQTRAKSDVSSIQTEAAELI